MADSGNMRHFPFVLLVLAALTGPLGAQAPAPDAERAITFVVTWDENGPSVDNVQKKELPVPLQNGMPSLWSRFFELRDADGDVHYSGPLVDTRSRTAAPTAFVRRVTVPDLDDAHHLVIIERVSQDPDTARKIVLERDL